MGIYCLGDSGNRRENTQGIQQVVQMQDITTRISIKIENIANQMQDITTRINIVNQIQTLVTFNNQMLQTLTNVVYTIKEYLEQICRNIGI